MREYSLLKGFVFWQQHWKGTLCPGIGLGAWVLVWCSRTCGLLRYVVMIGQRGMRRVDDVREVWLAIIVAVALKLSARTP